MGEMNESERYLIPNATNQILFYSLPCSGSRPSKTVVATTYAVLTILSLIGNSLIVAVFYRNKTLRTPVHYFIANMAISDLLLPVVVLPGMIVETYYDYIWLVDGVLGTILCKLVRIASSLSANVSILSMVAIAVDRFHAILFAMKPALVSRKTCHIIIGITWVASVALRAHYLYGFRLVRVDTKLYCIFLWEPASYAREARKITWISFLCLSTLSAIVLTVLYSAIIIFLHRQKSNLHMAAEVNKLRAKENRKVTCFLLIIVLSFYAVWIPHHVQKCLHSLSIMVPCYFIWVGDRIPQLYPIINPVVYYMFNEKYRRGFRELLCCPWPCNNKCKECFHSSVSPQGEQNVEDGRQANNAVENIELQEQ